MTELMWYWVLLTEFITFSEYKFLSKPGKQSDRQQPDQQQPDQQQPNQNLRLWVTSIGDYTTFKNNVNKCYETNFT